jgi:hypothetical protein
VPSRRIPTEFEFFHAFPPCDEVWMMLDRFANSSPPRKFRHNLPDFTVIVWRTLLHSADHRGKRLE